MHINLFDGCINYNKHVQTSSSNEKVLLLLRTYMVLKHMGKSNRTIRGLVFLAVKCFKLFDTFSFSITRVTVNNENHLEIICLDNHLL